MVTLSVKLLKHLGILTLSTQEYSVGNLIAIESNTTVEIINCLVFISSIIYDFDLLLKHTYSTLLPGLTFRYQLYIQTSTGNKCTLN